MTWAVEEFTVTPEDARIEQLRAMFSFSGGGRHVPPGTYRRLTRNGKVIMSDTPDELCDLSPFRRMARGKVLINGLGLGCALRMALAKPEVEHVTVIEIEQEVIDLITPALDSEGRTERLHVICADALTWPIPNIRYGAVWHDIWDDICADNLAEMKRLHRRYGRHCDWQGSWCRAECERA